MGLNVKLLTKCVLWTKCVHGGYDVGRVRDRVLHRCWAKHTEDACLVDSDD